MKQALLVFFALILLRFNAVGQTHLVPTAEQEYQAAISNACIHGYRMMNEELIDLSPLIDWYQIKKGSRPLQEWKLILGTVVQMLPEAGMLVETDSRFSPDKTSYQVRLKNHPHEKYLSVGRPVQVLARRDGTRFLVNGGAQTAGLESFDYGLIASKEDMKPILEKANADLEAKRQEIAGNTNKTTSSRDETDTELVPRSLAAQRSLAAEGNAKAQYYLGLRYWQGDGVEKDQKTALNWLNQSAAKGCDLAVRFLARNKTAPAQ